MFPSSLHQDLRKSSTFHPNTVSTMVPVLLFLLPFLGPVVPQETQDGELGSEGWVWRRMDKIMNKIDGLGEGPR